MKPALRVDPPVVGFDDLLGDGKTNSGATFVLRRSGTRSPQPMKELRHLFGWNSLPVIGDGEMERLRCRRDVEYNFGVRIRELDRIGDEIQQNLSYAFFVEYRRDGNSTIELADEGDLLL